MISFAMALDDLISNLQLMKEAGARYVCVAHESGRLDPVTTELVYVDPLTERIVGTEADDNFCPHDAIIAVRIR